MPNTPSPWIGGFRVAIAASALTGIALMELPLLALLPYFTIQTNFAAAVIFGIAAWASFTGRESPPSAVKGAVTLYLSITALVFHLVLANPASGFSMVEQMRGWGPTMQLGNHLLHTMTPLLAVVDWLLVTPGRHRWRDALWWLTYPLAYLVFALVRGALLTGPMRYPYPFVDVDQLGYGGVAVSAAVLTVAFLLLGLCFVALDRAVAKWARRAAQPA